MQPSRLRPLIAVIVLAATACGSGASQAVEPIVGLGPDHQPIIDDLNPGGGAPMTVEGPVVVELDRKLEPIPVAPSDPPIEPVERDDGPATARAQQRLIELGFWVQEASGEYGVTTSQAVMAFQKHYGLYVDGVLGPVTAEALSNVTERPEGRSNAGTLVEVDKSRQLVYLVRDGHTQWILNASTGSEIPYEEPDFNSPDKIVRGDSVTRPGVFEIYREREEGWWEGDLGEIYRPKYFDYGIALHGSGFIPAYPASHGCVRLSIPAMDWIWEENLIPKGTTVWVHGEIPERDEPIDEQIGEPTDA